MRPVSLTYTGTVGVTIQDVFDLISDASRMPEWLPNCVSTVPGPSNKGKGDRHRIHFERQGRKADAVIEVIEYEPPTTYAWVEIIYRRGSKTFCKLDIHRGTPTPLLVMLGVVAGTAGRGTAVETRREEIAAAALWEGVG